MPLHYFFFLLSILSRHDSVRSSPQYFSSSFRTHPDFISRAMISPRARFSLPRFPPYHYFLAVTSSVTLFSPHLLRCLRTLQRASDLTLSSYMSSILYSRHCCTPFLLSEGHWNRIKLYAGFSMLPFPPVAMKGGIRHGGRSGQRKMGRSHLNEVGRISLVSYQTS